MDCTGIDLAVQSGCLHLCLGNDKTGRSLPCQNVVLAVNGDSNGIGSGGGGHSGAAVVGQFHGDGIAIQHTVQLGGGRGDSPCVSAAVGGDGDGKIPLCNGEGLIHSQAVIIRGILHSEAGSVVTGCGRNSGCEGLAVRAVGYLHLAELSFADRSTCGIAVSPAGDGGFCRPLVVRLGNGKVGLTVLCIPPVVGGVGKGQLYAVGTDTDAALILSNRV